MNYYEKMKEYLQEKNCKLLNTKEEFDIIKQESAHSGYKIKYIASCGHEHNVFFNVFKNRGTGIICPNCKTIEHKNKKREQIINKEISPIQNTISEFKFICKFKELVKDNFDMIKAYDGCKVDLIYKPKYVTEDKWVGIQVKTNNTIHLTYSFNFQNNINGYRNCLILLYCHQDESLWIIPENIISNQTKISIGINKSRYNIYKVEKENIINKLNELYETTTTYSFQELDSPVSIYQQREKEFRKYRENIIKYINFEYENMEATVYDFKINGLKIQEKVITVRTDNNNLYLFSIVKNNKNKQITNKSHCQYEIGDNDFYWINCDNKQVFFVIPEKILIEKGYVGNINGPIHFSLNPYNLTLKTLWISPYMFDYVSINQQDNKSRLLKILGLQLA